MQNCNILPWGSCSRAWDSTRETESREAQCWARKGLGRGGRLNRTGGAGTARRGSNDGERAWTVRAASVMVRAWRGGEREESLSEWR
jgi:hypothetical protein